jgi:integral membrane protein (TIGR00529 family)
VWEYLWPLDPGVVVTAALLNRQVRDIFLANFPLTIAAIAGGVFFVLRGVKAGRNERRAEADTRARRDVLFGVWPFAVVIAGVLVLKIELIIVALAVIALLALFEKAGGHDLGAAFKRGAEFQIITLVIGVAAYKHLLTAAGIVEAVPEFFLRVHMPEVFVIFALPMIIGLITGVTLAYIAVAFPLLLPLMGGDNIDMTLVMFGYASGFVGVLLSPVHLCLVLSRGYFRANFGKSYRLLILPSLTIMAVAVIIVLL